MNLKLNALFAAAIFSSNVALAEPMLQKPEVIQSVEVKQQLEVLQINHDERWVLLKDRSGFTKKVEAPKAIHNFEQIETGDIVKIHYGETIHIQSFDSQDIDTGASSVAAFARAPKGQLPEAMGVNSTTVVVTISDIDKDTSLITLMDSKGNTKIIKPRISENTKRLKVGDKIAITVAEALSIKVNNKS